MEFPPPRASADDDLFLMDELLLLKNEASAPAAAHAMDVDALLMGFDFDEHAAFALEHAAQQPLTAPMTSAFVDAAPFAPRATARSFDGSASPTTSDDMSGSEMSSPPPSFDASPASSPVRLAPRAASSPAATYPPVNSSVSSSSSAVRLAPGMPNAMGTFGALPYALPVAYFPNQSVLALNANQKRPLQPEVLPSAPTATATALAGESTGTAASDAKKSKREIRQMKNRESANKSRLRRKAQMSELSEEVGELTKKQHELENTIAALRAENKSLHDQNAFLRSLVAKPAGSADLILSQQQQQIAAGAAFVDVSAGSALSAMENGQEPEFVPPQKKAKTSRATTFSAASLSLCASVFGVTLFSDYEGGAADAGHIRRPGRVLHSLPAAAAAVDSGFSPAPWSSALDFAWDSLASFWTRMSSSELAFGVFLNVLSFVVIMGLYHLWESSLSAPPLPQQQHRAPNGWSLSSDSSSSSGGGAHKTRPARADAKRRSGSWHDGANKTLLTRVRDLL